MAKSQPASDENNTAQPGKKKLFVILLVVMLFILLAAGGAAVWLLGGKPQEGQDEEEHVEKVEEDTPIFERLETFTVNLADQESYLQVEVSLKLANPKVQETVKQRMPEVRNVLLRVLSSKTPEELMSSEGKLELAKEIRKEVNGVIGAKKESTGVKDVLFTSFIIQ